MTRIVFLDTAEAKIRLLSYPVPTRRKAKKMADGRPGRPKKYSDEYRTNAVDYYLQSGKTQRQCAEDLGIPLRTLTKWIQARTLTAPERERADEIRALRKEVEQLRTENEFLKKAAAFFAANQHKMN